MPDRLRAVLLLGLALAAAPVHAQPRTVAAGEAPEPATRWRVAAIQFSGNETTQPRVMLRELPFRVGDTVDEAHLERGRQAILDLGLFKAVEREQRHENGAVTVTYRVDERWYVLPIPRVDANADGQYSYGAQLRWNNLWGLNHTLRATWLLRESQREGVGRETQYVFSYGAPLINDSRWSLGFAAAHTERPVQTRLGVYDEQLLSVQAEASRSLGSGPPSQGWRIGTGLLYQRQDTSGLVAPYGEATAPVFTAGYRDLRFNVFSETGIQFGSRLELAGQGWGSDYDYAKLTAGLVRYWPFGNSPHQTLHFIAETGLNWEGPEGLDAFSLGGSSALRGYDRDFLQGDVYYRLAVEWVRPVVWPWLRVAVIGEAGAVAASPADFDAGDTFTSLGLGLRLRLPAFVDFEVEAGIALPLDGGKTRFFGGRV